MRSLRELIYPKFQIQKRARKLLVEYDGQSFRVISDRKVAMAPPPSDPIANYQAEQGYWYSVGDAQGRVLYRRVMATSQFQGIEVFTNSPAEHLYRLDAQKWPITLSLVIPDLALGVRLDMFGPPSGSGDKAHPSQVMTSLNLNKKTDTKGDTHERQ